MILIGYDGSADARATIDRVATLMPGAPATVLAVWKGFEPLLEYHGGLAGAFRSSGPLSHAPEATDYRAWDTELEAAAAATATEGADRATSAGLKATPQTTRQVTSIADAILDAAADLDATAIVVGSRGLTGAKSWFLGSVSHAVLQHADRPVIVTPSEAVAAKRAEHQRRSASSG